MAELCTFWGTSLAFASNTNLSTNTNNTGLQVISMSGLEWSNVILQRDSFTSPAGSSRKCFAPIKDHSPLRITAFFDDEIFDAAYDAVVGTVTETLTIDFAGTAGARSMGISGKVVRISMGEETIEDRPTMIIEFQHDGITYTNA